MSNHDWTPAVADPRIQTRWTGGGYQARWELPIPATRGRCLKCRKDLVIVGDASGTMPREARLYKHKCEPAEGYERGYGYVRRAGNVRLFGTLSQAVEVARERAATARRRLGSHQTAPQSPQWTDTPTVFGYLTRMRGGL